MELLLQWLPSMALMVNLLAGRVGQCWYYTHSIMWICSILGIVEAKHGHIDVGHLLAIAAEDFDLTVRPGSATTGFGLKAISEDRLSRGPTPNRFLSLDGWLPVDEQGIVTADFPGALQLAAG
ncbi:hypothetical protein FN846DRAFT_917131 [Sphaerosporella brunnea]|uniref:Uncharacterized protein n=1 Tax=Sphaerosporella brunnea TaxID=1250544 RepID=A0A5J5F5B6_9PEZI|nr:hypothetical protein FN846DRAFT_917131 [Sphaerosporella brunnea]